MNSLRHYSNSKTGVIPNEFPSLMSVLSHRRKFGRSRVGNQRRWRECEVLAVRLQEGRAQRRTQIDRERESVRNRSEKVTAVRSPWWSGGWRVPDRGDL